MGATTNNESSKRTAAEATGGENIFVSFVNVLWVFFCIVFAMSLCAFVYMSIVGTCWEKADLLALVCGV